MLCCGYEVIILAISPIGLIRQLLPSSQLDEVASGLWELERSHLLNDLRQGGLAVIEWDPTQPLELALASQGSLSHQQRMMS
jgi:hypothetical protein